MDIRTTTLRDVVLFEPDVHTDFRGDYVMTYDKSLYENLGIDKEFVEHDVSYTHLRGVLRGIHYSPRCWKLNECLSGSIYYVVVNCDKEDKEYGKWESFILDDKKHHQLYKHPRYGSAFLTLTQDVVFHYMQSQYYNPDNPDQKTFKWNEFDIWWPIEAPILSQRDESGKYGFES